MERNDKIAMIGTPLVVIGLLGFLVISWFGSDLPGPGQVLRLGIVLFWLLAFGWVVWLIGGVFLKVEPVAEVTRKRPPLYLLREEYERGEISCEDFVNKWWGKKAS